MSPTHLEKLDAYERSRKRDRFTRELLEEYLQHFGIRPFFEDDFFVVTATAPAILLERPPWPNEPPDFHARRGHCRRALEAAVSQHHTLAAKAASSTCHRWMTWLTFSAATSSDAPPALAVTLSSRVVSLTHRLTSRRKGFRVIAAWERMQAVEGFVKTALECSIYVTPLDHGLTYDELLEAGTRLGFEKGEIGDAIQRVDKGRVYGDPRFRLEEEPFEYNFVLVR